jgi:hypothetical protein
VTVLARQLTNKKLKSFGLRPHRFSASKRMIRAAAQHIDRMLVAFQASAGRYHRLATAADGESINTLPCPRHR